MMLNEDKHKLPPTNVKKLIHKLYSDLFWEFAPEKISIMFAKNFDSKYNIVQIPLEVKYSPFNLQNRIECEDDTDTQSYFLSNENSKDLTSTTEVLILSENLVLTPNELNYLLNLVKRIYDILYYFFEKFDFKLNSINLKFMRIPILKKIEFICFFELLDNTLNLTDMCNGQIVNNIEFLEKIYSL